MISSGAQQKFLLQAGHTGWHPTSLEHQKNRKTFQKEQTLQVRAAPSFSTTGLWTALQNWFRIPEVERCDVFVFFCYIFAN